MKRICPKPIRWSEAFNRLTEYAQSHPCDPPSPPIPLILAGWAFSNDIDKKERWEQTVAWAEKNGCPDLIAGIPDSDFYYAKEPTNYVVGPLGGPMYLPWDYESKIRPSSDQLAQTMEKLISQWNEIVGDELARVTRPLAFTGKKARRLLVQADADAVPPWGGWSYLSREESKRRTFTRFRAAVNRAIAPHEVDHIDFVIDPVLPAKPSKS
jgi:hypothetical protein